MNNLHYITSCLGINFKKWKTNYRLYVVLIILILFFFYNFDGYRNLAEYLDIPLSPWIFPLFLANPLMFVTFGAFPMLLYGEAPFTDHQSPFIISRSGRANWIIGQILYIILSSLIYTITAVLISIFVLIPHVHFSSDWGTVFWTMAQSPEVCEFVEIKNIMPDETFLSWMSPLRMMTISFLLYWIDTVFIGIVIICFNILFKQGSGLIAAGILISLSYFSAIFGFFAFGKVILYLSPVSWSSITSLSQTNGADGYPPIWYAFTVLIAAILIMSVISVIAFCKKDLDFEKGEY